MIDELRVSNIALIREATLVPSAGLTVLTGETGAGKTALLSALKLILGERADSSTVREGETLASVEARLFDGPHDTEGFTVQRSLSTEGRSRVKIDGRIASVRELSERVGVMMDLCGQHEHQRLLDPAHHVAMVDAWAGRPALEALEHYRACFKASRAAAKEVRRVEEASRAQGSRVEEARFALERIAEVDPRPGEYEELEQLLPRSEHAEVLVATANDAHASLAAEGGALDALNSAVAELSRMASVDRKLGDIADALSDACISLEDCANELRAYRDGVAFDPRELSRMRERYSDLKGLLRQWGPTMDDVFAMRDRSQELLSLVDDGDAQIKKAREALGAAERELFAAAKALKRARNMAAPRFCHEVGRQMARLEMGGAELIVHVDPLERAQWTRAGASKVEFMYRAGTGMTPRPLARIASGGEVSRVMLACKVVLGEADARDTLVFDEVDAGVGGSVAVALAAVLADLAKTHQVIVVTHLAQVAVRGERHFMVKKTAGAAPNESEDASTAEAAIPETTLCELGEDERVREIARMLSGDASEASLAHAKEMLKNAR